MKRVLLSLSVFLVLMFLSVSAQAYLVDQSPYSTPAGLVSGNDGLMGLGSARVYDNFTLTSDASINQITWWGIGFFNPQFTITFYRDNGSGRPGSVFVPEFSTSAEGSPYTGNTDISQYSITLGTGHQFSAGTYWLSIYNAGPDSLWGWQIASYGDGSFQEGPPPLAGGYWDAEMNWIESTGGTSDVAFQLDYVPVPLPAAAWLLGPGLIALAGLRRRWSCR